MNNRQSHSGARQGRSGNRQGQDGNRRFEEKKFAPRPGGFRRDNFSNTSSPSVDLVQEFLDRRFGATKLAELATDTQKKIVDLLKPISVIAPVKSGESVPDRGFAKSLQLKKQPEIATVQDTKDLMDPWQQEALKYLLAGENVIIDAPTSAGKTRIIEKLIEAKSKDGLRLIYTSPVKSLSNDKYREFSEKFGRENIGINTGDFKENLNAPIVLATLETYRNSLLGVEPRMDRLVVVYDEYHYLQDEGRGSAWEESIILTPPETQLVLLSASVPNAKDFADWIYKLKNKTCQVISVSTRPVPLVDMVFVGKGFVFADQLQLQPRDIVEIKSIAKQKRISDKRFLRNNAKDRYLSLIRPVENVLKQSMHPLVVYASRRSDVENIAFMLARTLRAESDIQYLQKLRTRIEHLSGWEYVPSELQRLITKYGIAYHHSGLSPPGRVAIETLLKEGLLRICSGTMGISLGVNFAVRSALIGDESRPSENGDLLYSSTEIQQMLGRAGRRGCDAQGFSLWPDICRFVTQKPIGREPCTSSLKFDLTTVLGVLGQHTNLAYLAEFYKKSFFMIGRPESDVFVLDHDLIAAYLYKNVKNSKNIDSDICNDIPYNYQNNQGKKNKKNTECSQCRLKDMCHPFAKRCTQSRLSTVVMHLQSIRALDNATPTKFGELARYFPQSGGLLLAHWLASGVLNASNLDDFLSVMGCFCAPHHKEVPESYANYESIDALHVDELVRAYYPVELFAELYDENQQRELVFRDFNLGGASVVEMWVKQETTWENLVKVHETKNFSAGDIMMVLFRFATLLQSCARLGDYDKALVSAAIKLRKTVLREPLDARTRMLMEDEDENNNADSADSAEKSL